MPAWNVDGLQGGLVPADMITKRASFGTGEGRRLDNEAEQLLGVKPNFSDVSLGPHDEEADLAATYRPADMGSGRKMRLIILPNSLFRRIWVQVTLVVALYIIWVTPIRVGFDMQAQGVWFWIEGVIDIFFYVDLVLNFFTAYEHPVTSEIITDHKRIAKRYLSSWFWIDLLATFPSDYIVKGLEGTWGCALHNTCAEIIKTDTALSTIVLLRTMRVFRIIWIFKNFSVLSVNTIIGRLMDEFITVRWLFSILELLVVLIFLGHLCGCFFYMFSHPKWQTPSEKELIAEGELSTWVLDKLGAYNPVEVPDRYLEANNQTMPSARVGQEPNTGLWYICPEFFKMYDCPRCQGPKLRCQSDFGFAFRYITAMYWAYTTMTTVGYGDIVGTTIAEKVWCMCTMVIGGFFLSFCFGRIASVVSKLDADRAARNEQMEQVSQFLRDTELPKGLSRKVLDFFNSNFKGVKPYDRGHVLARMPFDLRSRILQHLYLDVIKNVPLLHKIAVDDEVFLTDFTIRLQPYHTSSDTFVYQRGELTGELYILVRGDLHVMDIDRKTPLFKIPEGTIFGESTIIKRNDGQVRAKRHENVFCSTACDMLRLPPDDACELCEMYPQLLKGLRRLDKARQTRLQTIQSGQDLTQSLGVSQTGSFLGDDRPSPQQGLSGERTSVSGQQQANGLGGSPLRLTEPLLPDVDSAGSGSLGPLNGPVRSKEVAAAMPQALVSSHPSKQMEALTEEVAALRALIQQLPVQLVQQSSPAHAGGPRT